MGFLKTTLIKLLKKFNLAIVRSDNLQVLIRNASYTNEFAFLNKFDSPKSEKLFKLRKDSKSQLRQDLLVLAILDFKKGGFFVEFGATNGVSLSNTYLLERDFGWTGILAEPAAIWYQELCENRPTAKIATEAVWSETGLKMIFKETTKAEYSTFSNFSSRDHNSALRKQGFEYEVLTISLNDLLERERAPQHIDYLSIDTEGSEFYILRELDFERYKFSVITCEHNFGRDRTRILDLLTSKGYKRILTDVSGFDDWYVQTEIDDGLSRLGQVTQDSGILESM